MAKQGLHQSPAEFLRDQGWKAPIVLRGDPIMRDGRQVEPGVILSVTAVGDNAVLARIAEGLVGRREAMWTFDSRDWWVNDVVIEHHGSPACLGGEEVGVDWINETVLHENDHDWHPDPELFAELADDRFDGADDEAR